MKTKIILQEIFYLIFMFFFCTSAAMANEAEEARLVIKTTAEEVIDYVKSHRSELEQDKAKLHKLVNEKLVPIVDFKRAARWILGKNWRKATKDQRLQFKDEFKKLLIKTYSSSLLKISDEKVLYPPVKGEVRNGKVSVKSTIITHDGKRFSVDYRMHNKDKDWKIYDISVDGVSLISTYRSSFTTEIRNVGLDGLIQNLVKKNKEFKT